MEKKEWETARLHRVVEVTLDEYVEECERMGHRVDKSGFILQILDKIESQGG